MGGRGERSSIICTFKEYIRGDGGGSSNNYFQHEYGHYIQSQASGPLYLFKYGIPSGLDAMNNDYWGHTKHWSEQDANRRAVRYFNDNEKDYNSWDWYLNPIYNANGNRISKGNNDVGKIVNPSWWEYGLYFGSNFGLLVSLINL